MRHQIEIQSPERDTDTLRLEIEFGDRVEVTIHRRDMESRTITTMTTSVPLRDMAASLDALMVGLGKARATDL